MAESRKRKRTGEHDHLQIPYNNFFQQVRKRFEKNAYKLRLYQQIMHEIKYTKFDIQKVVLKIYDLFHSHDDLIESFNFLLVHRRSRADIFFQNSVDFVFKVRAQFRDQEHVYAQFLDIVMRRETEGKRNGDLFSEVAALFCDHQDLLNEFRVLLSYNDAHEEEENQTETKEPEKEKSDRERDDDDDDESETRREQEYRDWVKSGIVWCKKVRSKLSGSDEYLDFLKCLFLYCRGDTDTNKTQLLDLLKSRLGMHSELMLDLDQFLEYRESKGAEKPWGPSYTLLPPLENRTVVSEAEPELKELNNRFLCRANNSNFKGRPLSQPEKKKFEWEDRRHKLDLKLEGVKSVIAQIQECYDYLKRMEGKGKEGMKDFMSILNIKCIEREYGRHASVILEKMTEEEDPSETLNLVLARMREIEKEQSNAIKKFRCIPKTAE